MSTKDTEQLENELKSASNIEGDFDDNEDNLNQFTFKSYFEYLISTKNLNKADIIKKSGLDQIYAYHIIAGRKNKPARSKIIALALAMQLKPKETQHLLHYAGTAQLYVRDSWDSVIYFALENHLTAAETDDLLNSLSQTPLN